ncbi:flavodoxin [Paenibacillus bovis]|uniref:Flavodoxin n=1 Tax=Paenibacillus bovis TaxID=1616788 RepID=A0A172ZIA1_9BACL|nr:flavodoxin [Paenibacillus bovis]ANF97364.1 flavodoxin [Paenibacillus bovis]
MPKILIVFASMTGNTEEMADLIAEGITSAGGVAELKQSMDVDADILLEYDAVMLGAYTWGDGELPDEFLDFYEDMDNLDLNGKKAAVFGSGDTAYDQYAAAVDLLTDKLRERGAEIVQESLKIELNPSAEDKETCRSFGKQFASTAVSLV